MLMLRNDDNEIICWKCQREINTGDWGKLGLCSYCWSDFRYILCWILFLVSAIGTFFLLPSNVTMSLKSGDPDPAGPYVWAIMRIVLAVLGGIAAVSAVKLFFAAQEPLVTLMQDTADWFKGLLRLSSYIKKQLNKKLSQQLIKQLPLPPVDVLRLPLSGQEGAEMDRELTEQQMKRNGWK
jgi:hypothetical protein